MLGRLMGKAQSSLARRRAPPQDQAESAAFSPEAFEFPPMTPLRPPPAQNDDVMQPVYEAVEQELRAAGYLG